MSYEDGWAALNLEMPTRIPRTEYSVQMHWDLIRAVWMSVCIFAIAPMQDFLNLDNTARMNYPGNPSGNWTWRMPVDALNPILVARLRETNFLYSRMAVEPGSQSERDAK